MLHLHRLLALMCLLGGLHAFTLPTPTPVAPVWGGSTTGTNLEKRDEGATGNPPNLATLFDITNLQATQSFYDQLGNVIRTQVVAKGIAITGSTLSAGAVSSGTAKWVYSSAISQTTTDLPAVSDSTALLVPRNASGQYAVTLNLITDPHWYGKAALTFRVWDGATVGTEFTQFDTQNGTNVAFSAATNTLVVEVYPINQAPTGAPTRTSLTAWSVGSTQARATLVGALAAGLTDIDYPAASLAAGLGLAVVQVDASFLGTLAYSLDGTQYNAFPTIGNGEVLCLPPTAHIRSTPASAPSGVASGPTAFTALIWDGTTVAIAGGATGNYPLDESMSRYESRFTNSGLQTQNGLTSVSALSGTRSPISYTQPTVINASPVFTVLPTTSGTLGSPYQGDITVTDADNDTITLSLVSGPAGLTLTDLGGGRGRVTGTSSVNGSLVLRASDARGATQDATVGLLLGTTISTAFEPFTFTAGSARKPRYFAIAPNSTTGMATLRDRLAALGPRTARGFWWNGAFQELTASLPATSRQDSTGVFVAATTGLTLPTSAAAKTMPFSITLDPGWNFIGIPPAWNGTTSTAQHAWGDFGLSDSSGNILSDDAQMLAQLAVSGASSIPGPYGYDPDAGYARTTTLLSGRGYWLKHYGTTNINLVRVDSGDTRKRVSAARSSQAQSASPRGALSAAPAQTASSAPASDDLPPPPPSGAQSQDARADETGSGHCGGGIAALLLGLPLILRRRSRRG